MQFYKMHGLGNDFLFVPGEQVYGLDVASLAVKISHRRTGIGCDQLITYTFIPSNAVVEMKIYNPDGSSAGACGNATRCMMKLLNMHYGVREVKMSIWGREVLCRYAAEDIIMADMGIVSFAADWMPEVEEILKISRRYSSTIKDAICADIGNKHLIFFVDSSTSLNEKQTIGSLFEKGKSHNPSAEYEKFFPQGVNVNFAIVGADSIDLIVWERCAGFTSACGTGACVTVAAARKLGMISSDSMYVNFPMGRLKIELHPTGVHMCGNANFVAEGDYILGDKEL